MSDLAKKSCVPCQGGVPPLEPDRVAALLAELDGWTDQDNHHLTKTYTFPDFVSALAFVNQVGAVAERRTIIPTSILHGGRFVLTFGRIRSTA